MRIWCGNLYGPNSGKPDYIRYFDSEEFAEEEMAKMKTNWDMIHIYEIAVETREDADETRPVSSSGEGA